MADALSTTGGPSDDIRRTVLPGGLRLLTEVVPGVRSVAFGIWVGVGSRDESRASGGASHFLEHLLFKGTRRRDALAISSALDEVGGELNAFTTKEYTCYYARVLDDDLPLAVDVVADMVTSSRLASADVEAERGVILEEIAMHDDDPGDAVHDVFAEAVLGDSPLGRPVLGTVASIEAISRTTIAGYYRRRYTPPAMVVAAAGNLDHDRVRDLVLAAFDGQAQAPTGARPPAPRAQARPLRSGAALVVDRPTEQANVVLGGVGLSRTDERRFALSVLSAAFGGGMSSRLFQEVREKRGLAYSVYSFTAGYADSGLFGVYAGCATKRADDVLALCREQLDLLARDGLTDAELARGKGQVTGGMVLGLEDTGARMTRLGKGELLYGEVAATEDILARVAAVTPDDVRALARDLLAGPLSLGAVGPFGDRDLTAAVA